MTFKIETYRAVGKLLGSCGLLIVAVVVSLVLSATAQAAPGDLDPAFSDDGVQTTPFPGDIDDAQANDVAIQANGKIVTVAGGGEFALARYLGG